MVLRTFAILGVALIATSCGGDGGDPSDQAEPRPAATEETDFIRLSGYLSVVYVIPADLDCKTDSHGQPTSERIEEVKGRAVEVRNEDGEIVGTATTANVTRLEPAGDTSGSDQLCLALSEYAVEVPKAGSYAISVQGAPGGANTISSEELEELGFQCDLQLLRNLDLSSDSPCEDVGVDA